MEDDLTKQEEEELGKLEEGSMKTIKEVYEKLTQDKEVQELVEKIKSHEWVKVIEDKE